MNNFRLTQLNELEAEAIFVIREVAAQFENPTKVALSIQRAGHKNIMAGSSFFQKNNIFLCDLITNKQTA